MLPTHARDQYLTNEVLTATPQKLQLLLIEGALSRVQRAREFWRLQRDQEADMQLSRAQEIVTQILCNLNPEGDRELVRRIASVYLFLFRTLTSAHLERDDSKLAEFVRVLEVERDTWRQACEKWGSTQPQVDLSYLGSSFVA